MNKRATALLIAAAISCLNFGDKRHVGAQPLEIQTAVYIPGPPLVVQKPLELSMDQRIAAEQILAECRLNDILKQRVESNQNTDRRSLGENPLPGLSALLSDAYSLVAQKKSNRRL